MIIKEQAGVCNDFKSPSLDELCTNYSVPYVIPFFAFSTRAHYLGKFPEMLYCFPPVLLLSLGPLLCLPFLSFTSFFHKYVVSSPHMQGTGDHLVSRIRKAPVLMAFIAQQGRQH